MPKIIHLDCTFRDGGYYNNWNFDKKLAKDYLNALSEIKINYVEIGFRFFEKTESKGAFAYCEESFLNKLAIPKNVKIAVMINAGDLIFDGKYNRNLLKKKFIKKKRSKITLVRIACHFHELDSIGLIVKDLKILGYEVGINLMQISNKTKKEITKAIILIKKINPKVLYFADSLGSLDVDKTKKIINNIKQIWKKDLGIHTHDNLGNALKNSLISIKNGVKWVDTTVTGMGRGPGNTKTELAILEIEKIDKRKINILPLLNLIKKEFKDLHNKYSWGTNSYYYLASLWNIHPSFVQEMLIADFPSHEMLKNLNNLKNIGGQKFSKDLINTDETFYHGKTKGSWEPKKILKNKNILILGSGPLLKKNSSKIQNFILKKKPIVFLINNKNYINKKLINFRIASYTMRILLDSKKYNQLKIPLIVPYQRFSDRVKNQLKKIDILDYGLEVKKNIFDFKKSSCVIPNSLAFSYSLAIANSGEVDNIYLAGFDGYTKNHPKKYQMDQIITNYKKIKNKAKIYSLTKTSYKIKKIKI